MHPEMILHILYTYNDEVNNNYIYRNEYIFYAFNNRPNFTDGQKY